jgi:hypothetical protein
LRDRPLKAILDEIVRQIGVVRQRARIAAQCRHMSFDLVQERGHAPA